MFGTYKTKDVASKTGIPGNLIRKYSQTLEQNGYEIGKASGARCFKVDDIKLLRGIHERVIERHTEINEAVQQTLSELQSVSTSNTPVELSNEKEAGTPDVSVTIREQNKKFEEFINKLDTLAQLNEAIIHQNSTLITQNRQKDEKLDDLMQQVYVKETKQEEILNDLVSRVHKNDAKQEDKLNNLMSQMSKKEAKQEEILINLVGHVHKSDAKQEDKLNNLISQIYKKETKQEEKMSKMINQVYKKEATRDEQLMEVIRNIQETKRMIAASQENTVIKSLRSIISRFKPERTPSR